ncbi:unnamed protein product [Trichobilharzia szidati]|nr:unnamed protein product [Trichobilharzia szidati]
MLCSLFGNTVAIYIFLRKRKSSGNHCHPTIRRLTGTERNITSHHEEHLQNQTQSDPENHNFPDVFVSSNNRDYNSSMKKHLDNSVEKAQKRLRFTIRSTYQKRTFNVNPSFDYYLASLAISDFFMGVFCIPFTFTQIYLHYWPFPDLMCPIVVYVQLVMVTASSLTNTAISVNRLFGIVGSLNTDHWHSRHQQSFTIGIIICIWTIAFTGSTVQLFATRTDIQQQNQTHSEQEVEYPVDIKLCQESWDGDEYKRSIYTIVLFLVIYVIPLGIQISTYGYIAFRLWNRITPGEQIKCVEDVRLKEKKRIIKMLVFIVAMFGVCWLPSHLFFLLQDFHPEFRKIPDDSKRIIFGVCHWIAMSNTFVNPIIYLIMSKSFRDDFKQIMKCTVPCWSKTSLSNP